MRYLAFIFLIGCHAQGGIETIGEVSGALFHSNSANCKGTSVTFGCVDKMGQHIPCSPNGLTVFAEIQEPMSFDWNKTDDWEENDLGFVVVQCAEGESARLSWWFEF